MVYTPNEIAIGCRDNDQQNHWASRGVPYFQTNPKPNGFADHYPVLQNGYFIGNINPTFSDKP